jgi:uncharacterized membrane protein (DUF2068 family)
MWIGVVFTVLGVNLLLVAMPEASRPVQIPTQFVTVIAVIVVGIAALEFIVGLGLWHMKNWARTVLLVFTGLGLLGNVVQLASGLAGRGQASHAIGAVVGLAVGGLIFYWFAANGEQFT